MTEQRYHVLFAHLDRNGQSWCDKLAMATETPRLRAYPAKARREREQMEWRSTTRRA